MKRAPIDTKVPIVFACSGCSNAGQLANRLALEFNRRGLAEMSCLAGFAAGKTHFLKKLQAREVWIIDGCPLECSVGVFDQVLQHVDVVIRLHELGVRKNDPELDDDAFGHFVKKVLSYIDMKRASA